MLKPLIFGLVMGFFGLLRFCNFLTFSNKIEEKAVFFNRFGHGFGHAVDNRKALCYNALG